MANQSRLVCSWNASTIGYAILQSKKNRIKLVAMGKDYVQIPLHDEAIYPEKPEKKSVVASRPVEYKPRRCSPCVKILLTLLVVIVVLPIVLATIVTVSGYFFVAGKIKTFTVTEPRSFPIVEYPEAELQLVVDRVSLYFDDLQAGRIPTQDLVITADEVNGIIGSSEYLRGNAFVQMEENKITIDTSVPMPNFLPGGKGRYFVSSTVANMSGVDTLAVDIDAPIDSFHGRLVTGVLQFSMDDEKKHHVMTLLYGKAFDKEPCEMFYKEKHNLLDIEGADDFLRTVDRIEKITLANGQIVIKARQTTEDLEDKTVEYEAKPLSPWNLLRRLY